MVSGMWGSLIIERTPNHKHAYTSVLKAQSAHALVEEVIAGFVAVPGQRLVGVEGAPRKVGPVLLALPPCHQA